MKYDKFFELAKAKGISEVELAISTSSSFSVSLFHGEIDNYSSSSSSTYLARGIYNGKLGAISADSFDKNSPEKFVNEIINNAKFIENDDPVFIFKGSPKYKKINTFNKDLAEIPVENKLKKLHELEQKIKAADKRIVEVEGVSYEEESSGTTIINSHGLKLSQKTNYFFYYGGAVAKDKGQTKTGGEIYFNNDFSKFDVDKLANQIATNALEQLNGEAPKSATYQAVLAPEVVKSLLNAYISSAIAEDVQKNSSLFVGKLGKRIASNKVTVSDLPLKKTLFAKGFDDEGVATYNKAIIKNGVLQTYLYNLSSAAKDNVASTGNGVVSGSKTGTDTIYLEMKPGKLTQEELFEQVGNGVYITEVSGLHAGLNPKSGNFSLQSAGFLIKDGKKDHPLDIITISGNLVELFNNVIQVGSDSKEFVSAINVPSVLVKKLVVSGK